MVVDGVRNPNPAAGDLTIEDNLGVEKSPVRSSVARCGYPPSCSSLPMSGDWESMVNLERGSAWEGRCLALTCRWGSSWRRGDLLLAEGAGGEGIGEWAPAISVAARDLGGSGLRGE
uniref:Uncharacterized protein n=1 Tax=Arundo donax TaxID=35708 RepID=A0A0A9G6C1_ARUDO